MSQGLGLKPRSIKLSLERFTAHLVEEKSGIKENGKLQPNFHFPQICQSRLIQAKSSSNSQR